ncbi:Bug family tripartite tricarboxylate transporter substrate binding protein [Parapusillimonas granuli]|uniref:Tripartite tricarboxylate transporter substrate binding protein n=1 Tax=Parapusillimonas granuli TaxID=380911 RepID=A0A853G2T5_9BURK|nr:tripartite tricarboxylate transporter substrate binding protein [Parapusillimonas granuli]MBB5214541.1 tripartite-type tricarboxylate transporter receptor subunit TctC [Parapusillimonas granuli]MEB2398210.1 tripartite tricarboxylate transporter substrate binding protein [Alcaligenaceae bacterium]NYT49051.1 tripartite tricarboxylate transporter substrate binding protein [Parapusillimonas granuli]
MRASNWIQKSAVCLATVGGMFFMPLSGAAPAWPAAGKTITIVVPFPAGSGSDALARMLAQKVTEQTGSPVVVDNKPGAGTIIGAQHVARAAPDGYTLLYTIVVTHTQNPHLVKNLPYDAFKDFTPVLQVVRSATVLSANKDAPFSTTKELIEYAKANPGKVNYASYSMGSTSHLNGEILKREGGIDIVHVPYKGTSDASRALLAGDVQVYFDGTSSAVEKWRAGQVKLLGPATDKRLKVLKDLPTLEEQGLPGLNIVGWQGLFAPGNLPPELAERIAEVFRKALNTPQVAKYIEDGGNEVSGAGPAEYAKIVRSDYERWGSVIRDAGIRLE